MSTVRAPDAGPRVPSPRRRTTLLLGALGAVLVGGVGQAVVWRWQVDWLSAVWGSQFAWVLLCFVVAWAWSGGRLVAGAAAGAATGLALTTCYYLGQAVVDGPHSAVGQFTGSHGLAWAAASFVGGGGVGLAGACAGSSAVSAPQRTAFGLVTAAVVVGAGPALWLLLLGDRFQAGGKAVAVSVYACVGAVLVAIAVGRCGFRAAVLGAGMAVLVAAGLLVTLLVLQQHLLYPTF